MRCDEGSGTRVWLDKEKADMVGREEAPTPQNVRGVEQFLGKVGACLEKSYPQLQGLPLLLGLRPCGGGGGGQGGRWPRLAAHSGRGGPGERRGGKGGKVLPCRKKVVVDISTLNVNLDSTSCRVDNSSFCLRLSRVSRLSLPSPSGGRDCGGRLRREPLRLYARSRADWRG